MKFYSIETGNLKLDGGAMFGVVPKVMWNKLYPADQNNLINLSMRCLLIKTANRLILIDNGIGTKQNEKFLKHYYLNGDYSLEQSLAKVGYKTDDITDMILTHLHFDHCGGSIKYNKDRTQLEPTFKNAIYWTSKQQWDNAVKPNNREKASFLKENILPIQESGQLKLIQNNDEIYPGIKLKLFNGHTTGQVIPHIHTGNKTIVYAGDLLPTYAHIPLPYIMSYDMFPLTTLEEKEVFLNKAVEDNYLIFFEHDLYHECCNLQMTEKGIRVKDFYSLKDYFEQ
ncbi:MAG: MBL fold metallo-hydrolase [Chlorobi bacterium]|nr:MBL fold metallo-hydrolase [Chlorobiota bacterium]